MAARSGIPFKRGAALVGEPPNVLVRRPFVSEVALVPKGLEPLHHPDSGQTKIIRHLLSYQNRVVRLLKEHQYLNIAHRRLSAGHHAISHLSPRDIIYHRYVINYIDITEYVCIISVTGKTIRGRSQLLANDCRDKVRVTKGRNGPEGPAVVEHPMKAPHNRTGTDGRNAHSTTGFSAGHVPDRDEQERQLRGIVNRHPMVVFK